MKTVMAIFNGFVAQKKTGTFTCINDFGNWFDHEGKVIPHGQSIYIKVKKAEEKQTEQIPYIMPSTEKNVIEIFPEDWVAVTYWTHPNYPGKIDRTVKTIWSTTRENAIKALRTLWTDDEFTLLS
jgi:GH15 family glucan-1,4-alpha-glucosidase